jgi:hypothetical protein
MLLKGWAIKASTVGNMAFLAVAAFYFFRYFPLHELTQLRAACAIALILVGAIFLWERTLSFGLFFCAAALLFQISAAAIIPALFITTSKRAKILLITFLVFVLISVYTRLFTTYLTEYIPILLSYQAHGFSEIKPNPFSIALLIDWIMIIVSLVIWDRLTLLMKRIILLQLIGIAIYYGGMEFGVIAHRVRELYSVLWVFFVADGLRLRATKALCSGFIFVCILFYSYTFFFKENFFS